jgi:succinate dehydrogenase hydrophobic anchor subunit
MIAGHRNSGRVTALLLVALLLLLLVAMVVWTRKKKSPDPTPLHTQIMPAPPANSL